MKLVFGFLRGLKGAADILTTFTVEIGEDNILVKVPSPKYKLEAMFRTFIQHNGSAVINQEYSYNQYGEFRIFPKQGTTPTEYAKALIERGDKALKQAGPEYQTSNDAWKDLHAKVFGGK